MNMLRPSTDSLKVPEEHLPKQFADVVVTKRVRHPDYGDYENSKVTFNFQDDYEFQGKLGRGRYSEVFKAVNLLNNQDVVVKMLKPGKSIED